jgi:myo-inositol 2-dehydrogenase / D-chiro-inositol 1-dehydrogenase
MSTALILGAGRMARLRLSALTGHDAIAECIVATRDPDRAADLAQQGVQVAAMADLEHVVPDVVFVTSATARHDDDVTFALSFGCPVLCEKPLTEDSVSGRDLVARADASGTPLHVAFQLHFAAPIREMRNRLAKESLGVLYHLRFTHMDRYPRSREFIATSGGIFKDLLVHDIECALWLTQGSVRSVFATGAVRNWPDYAEFGDCDTATVVMTMEDGLTVTIQGTRHHPLGQDLRVEAIGSKDAVCAGLTSATPVIALDAAGLFNNDAAQRFENVFGAALPTETRGFVDFALGRTDEFKGTPAEAAVEAVLVAEACERSRAEGQVVEITRAKELR